MYADDRPAPDNDKEIPKKPSNQPSKIMAFRSKQRWKYSAECRSHNRPVISETELRRVSRHSFFQSLALSHLLKPFFHLLPPLCWLDNANLWPPPSQGFIVTPIPHCITLPRTMGAQNDGKFCPRVLPLHNPPARPNIHTLSDKISLNIALTC